MKRKAMLIPLLIAVLVLQMTSLAWAWQSERPGDDINLRQRDESAYTNGEASVGLAVAVDDYDESDNEYGGSDSVALNISMTSNSRQGIRYSLTWPNMWWWISEGELWHRTDYADAGDDNVIPADIPQNEGTFAFRFYGGYGSAEYGRVFISTNGFVGFQSDTTPAANPVAAGFPNMARPNDLIAAVWTDLNIDSESAVITGLYPNSGRWYFVIIWNNALHKGSGQRLTFEVILQDAPQYYPSNTRYKQSQIYVSYRTVSAINTNFAMGIENLQGDKGAGGLYAGASLSSFAGRTCLYEQSSSSFFIRRLTISLQDTNPQTRINIKNEVQPEMIGGLNVRLKSTPPPEPNEIVMWATTLTGATVLLIEAASIGGAPVAAGCILVDTVLVTLELAGLLDYYQYRSPEADIVGDATQAASISALSWDYVVDATLSIVADWVLDTPNNAGTHSLTVTSSLEYYEYLDGNVINRPPITTSVNLNIGPDDNDTPSRAYAISSSVYYGFYIGAYDRNDYYKIHVDQGNTIDVHAEATWSPGSVIKPDFSLSLYNTTGSKVKDTNHGYSNSLNYKADSTGDWLINARIYANHGFYWLWVSIYFPGGGSGGGGGGGCVAKGTLITTGDGFSKTVERIKPGDEILSYDPNTTSFAIARVLSVTSAQVKLIANINNGALRLTPTDQPIYIRNSTYIGWIRNPEQLEIGWQVYNAVAGTWVRVTNIYYETEKTWVYDFITDGYRTYLANSLLLMDKGYPK